MSKKYSIEELQNKSTEELLRIKQDLLNNKSTEELLRIKQDLLNNKSIPTQLKPRPDVNVTMSSSPVTCSQIIMLQPALGDNVTFTINTECNTPVIGEENNYYNIPPEPCCVTTVTDPSQNYPFGSVENPVIFVYSLCRDIDNDNFVMGNFENQADYDVGLIEDEYLPYYFSSGLEAGYPWSVYGIYVDIFFVHNPELCYAYVATSDCETDVNFCGHAGDGTTCLYLDECGVCAGDSFYIDCIEGDCDNMDCAGICGGSSEVDENGFCVGPCTNHADCNPNGDDGKFCHSGWNGEEYGPRTCRTYDPDYCKDYNLYGNYPCGVAPGEILGDGDCDDENECGGNSK